MRETYTHEYSPDEWSVDLIERSLRKSEKSYEIPRYGDREAWRVLRCDPLTGPVVNELLEEADELRGGPIPPLPANLFLDYSNSGNRSRYQSSYRKRRRHLAIYVAAECLEGKGTYLDSILDYAWAFCEQSTWVLPAHLEGSQNIAGLPVKVTDEERTVALVSVDIALQLAEIDYLFGDELHPALRQRIRSEVNRRVIRPYLVRNDFEWQSPPTNNWNAVCNAGTMIAALHLLPDPRRQARVIKKGVTSLRHYLAGFDTDGCTAEGAGYWNYGFGNYVMVAAALEAFTDGKLSLLDPPIVREIATFLLNIELSPGHYVPFSDTTEEAAISPGFVAWLGTHLDLECLGARARNILARRGFKTSTGNYTRILRDLVWTQEVPPEWTVSQPDKRQFLQGYEWWITRAHPAEPEQLVIAAKGGHNGESHNHNDCGTFVIHYQQESLLTDLGSPTYDRDYFSEKRYTEYLSPRSLGHSVPYVNGYEQRTGAEYSAEVIDRSSNPNADSFELELAGCYPAEARIDSLRREFILERKPSEKVIVIDQASFTQNIENTFQSVLVSYFPLESIDGQLSVTGNRARATITPKSGQTEINVEKISNGVNDRDVWRAWITPPVDTTGAEDEVKLRLVVEPAIET